MKKYLEGEIQGYVVDYARRKGLMGRKYRNENRRSAPDYIFMLNGRVLFIEFKATGKHPTPNQLKEHKKLRDYGMEVVVVDKKETGKHYIDMFLDYANSKDAKIF